MRKLRIEFTVEPFVAGSLGPHVRAAIEALEARGFTPEIGPFGTAIGDSKNSVRSTFATRPTPFPMPWE